MILRHDHMIGRFEVTETPDATKVHFMDWWIKGLIEKIGMNLLAGPISAYVDVPGNKGWTGSAIIEQSHIACHIWDEPNPKLIQIDVYSCSKLETERVIEHMQVFRPVRWEWLFLDRSKNLTVLGTGGGEKPASVEWASV